MTLEATSVSWCLDSHGLIPATKTHPCRVRLCFADLRKTHAICPRQTSKHCFWLILLWSWKCAWEVKVFMVLRHVSIVNTANEPLGVFTVGHRPCFSPLTHLYPFAHFWAFSIYLVRPTQRIWNSVPLAFCVAKPLQSSGFFSLIGPSCP